jgi:hypothetical protein
VKFGNNKNSSNLNDIVQKQEPQEIMNDRQTNSLYNDRIKTNKKRKDKKNDNPINVDSETTWREINLFWPETIALVAALVAGIILTFVVRYMSITGLELIKEMLTEQAYIEVAGLIGNLNTLFLGIVAIPFLVAFGFYAYRFFVFTPRGNKYPVLRIKRTGAIKFTVDKIKDMEIDFEKGMLSDKMRINNPRKHWFENNGKPCIILFEGDDCNADLNVLAGNVSSKSRDTNTINENAISLGRRIEKYIQEKGDGFMTPTNILLLLILGLLAVTAFLVLKNPETVAQVLGQAPVAMGVI